MSHNRTFAVCLDEIKQNFVFGDLFTESYQKSVTMSDGTTREITLAPMMRNDELVVKITDGSHVSYMGLNGTAVHGDLLIRLASIEGFDLKAIETFK